MEAASSLESGARSTDQQRMSPGCRSDGYFGLRPTDALRGRAGNGA